MSATTLTTSELNSKFSRAVIDSITYSVLYKDKVETLRTSMSSSEKASALSSILGGLSSESLADKNIQSAVASIL